MELNEYEGNEARMNQEMKRQAKDQVRKQAAMNQMKRAEAAQNIVTEPPKFTDEELINMMTESNNTVEPAPKKKAVKKKKKKKA